MHLKDVYVAGNFGVGSRFLGYGGKPFNRGWNNSGCRIRMVQILIKPQGFESSSCHRSRSPERQALGVTKRMLPVVHELAFFEYFK